MLDTVTLIVILGVVVVAIGALAAANIPQPRRRIVVLWVLRVAVATVLALVLWWIVARVIDFFTPEVPESVVVTPRVGTQVAVPDSGGEPSIWDSFWSFLTSPELRDADGVLGLLASIDGPILFVIGLIAIVWLIATNKWMVLIVSGLVLVAILKSSYDEPMALAGPNATSVAGTSQAAVTLAIGSTGQQVLPPGGETSPLPVRIGEYLQTSPIENPARLQYRTFCVDANGNRSPRGTPPCIEGGDFVAQVFQNATDDFLNFSWVYRRN